MYIGYIVLICVGALAALLCSMLFLNWITKKIEYKYNKLRPIEPYNPPPYSYIGINYLEEVAEFMEKDQEEYEKECQQYELKYKEWKDSTPLLVKIFSRFPTDAMCIITLCALSLLLIVGLIVLCVVLSALEDINNWKEFYNMAQMVIENGGELENFAISQTKIEYNSWLYRIISSINTWDNWTCWYVWKDEVLSLQYIT